MDALDWPDSVKQLQRNWIVSEREFILPVKVLNGLGESFDATLILNKLEDIHRIENVKMITGRHDKEIVTKMVHPMSGLEIPIVQTADASIATSGSFPNEHAHYGFGTVVPEVLSPPKAGKKQPTPGKDIYEERIKSFNLRDWLISRQRYWGTPIPMVHCSSCGIVPIPEAELPVRLPQMDSLTATIDGSSPLAMVPEWVNMACPQCKGPAKRETDTMDTFMDSSWYFLRYPDAHNKDAPFSVETIKKWLSVDVYIGGIEHAILHLLYARFIHRFLMKEVGLEGAIPEPFQSLITQGLVEGITHRCPDTQRYLQPHEISTLDKAASANATMKETGKETLKSWEKMSKSKFNGVDPLELISIFGADTLRLCVLFKAPPEVPLQWNTRDIAGPHRWLVRLLNLTEGVIALPSGDTATDNNDTTEGDLGKVVKEAIHNAEISYDPKNHKLNTIVATMMKLSNSIEAAMKGGTARKRELINALQTLALILHPMAPHTSAEILLMLHNPATDGSYNVLSWPAQQMTSCGSDLRDNTVLE